MTLASTRKRLKNAGPAPSGVSGGQFDFEKRGEAAVELLIPHSTPDPLQAAIDHAVEGIGEGMRPAYNAMADSVDDEGATDLFVQILQNNPRSDRYGSFMDSANQAKNLKELGYTTLDGFNPEGLTFVEAAHNYVAPERFEAVDRYASMAKSEGGKPELSLVRSLDDTQFESWSRKAFPDAKAAEDGMREAKRPGYLKDMQKLKDAGARAPRYSHLVLENRIDTDTLIEYTAVLGTDVNTWDIKNHHSRGVTPALLRDFGKRACNRFESADLAGGQLKPQELRALTHALPKFSYRELLDVKEQVDLAVYPPKALNAYLAFVHNPSEHFEHKSRGDQLIDLVNSRALPEEIEEIAQVLTHSADRDHTKMLRMAKLAARGLGSKRALERYLERTGTGFVNLKFSMLGRLSVVEAGLNNGYKATDMDAYSDSGLSLTDIALHSPHSDFWALGEDHRRQYTAGTGKPWHVTESQWRTDHQNRPSAGGPLG